MYYNLQMQFLIITSCTRRKRAGFSSVLTASQLTSGSHTAVANQWIALAQATEKKLAAEHLYLGRAINEVKAAADSLEAKVSFASTGFGLIEAKTELPNYDLTVADPADPIRSKIINETFSSQMWWSCVNQSRKTKRLVEQLKESTDLIILLALSKSYLHLLQHELAEIGKEEACRLRVFTSPDNENILPESIREAYIPYDERFDGLGSPIPGTRSDYPQRVLRHFSEFIIRSDSPDLDAEKGRVLELLGGMKLRLKVDRVQVSDDEIRNIIRQQLGVAKISAAKMLRVFRDDLLIACEQKRFSNIFREMILLVE